jgi:hypothetical protein
VSGVNEHVVIYASEGLVRFHIDQVGQLQMSATSAVELARRLLDAANEVEPGSGGFVWPPKVTL